MKHLVKLIVTAAVLATTATAAMADGAKIAVVGGKSDDPFFAKIKKGIDDAAMVVKAHGGSVNYLQLQTYDNIGGDAANLIRTAISQHASVIAAPDWVSDSEDEAYKAATAAGIPVMLYNAGGADKAKELGAINYIGNEEYPAGVAGGEYFAAHGAKNVICVNTVPGAGNLEARCKGISDGISKAGGKSNSAAAAGQQLWQPDCRRRGHQGNSPEGRHDRWRRHDLGCRRRQRCQRHPAGRSQRQGQARVVRHERDHSGPHQGWRAAVCDRPAALAAGFPGGLALGRVCQLRAQDRDTYDPDRTWHR